MAYLVHILTLISIYAILALSLNLVVGYAGLISLAHAAFYGIGAYAVAILAAQYGLAFFPGVLIGCAIAAAASAGVGLLLSRFRDDYYMLVSLGFCAIATGVFVNWIGLTGGPLGIAGIPRPIAFSSNESFLLLCLAFALLVFWASRWIATSSFGRALKGIREDEIVIQVLGYNTYAYKLVIFVFSAVCASIAGALYASYVSFIDPQTFDLNESIVILSMIIVGGLASIRGSIAGAAFLMLLPEILRFVGFPGALAGQMREFVFGLILTLLMLYRPKGLIGEYRL
ncbi:branched-chain amino acid ABC transporter permease [Candidatus Uhrbacteria bacterium]|nr:branched-chain amino acid ABC transporter permease [Candidatus Uhrbacteria bacterium]